MDGEISSGGRGNHLPPYQSVKEPLFSRGESRGSAAICGHSFFYGRFYNFCRTVDGSDTAKLRMAVQFYPCPGIRIAVIHPVCTSLLFISYRYYLMTSPVFVPCHGVFFLQKGVNNIS